MESIKKSYKENLEAQIDELISLGNPKPLLLERKQRLLEIHEASLERIRLAGEKSIAQMRAEAKPVGYYFTHKN